MVAVKRSIGFVKLPKAAFKLSGLLFWAKEICMLTTKHERVIIFFIVQLICLFVFHSLNLPLHFIYQLLLHTLVHLSRTTACIRETRTQAVSCINYKIIKVIYSISHKAKNVSTFFIECCDFGYYLGTFRKYCLAF